MIVKEITNEQFESFSNKEQSSLYQTKEYAFTMNKQKYDSLFVGLVEDEKILGASLILIEKIKGIKYAYAPRGFLLDYGDFELVKNFTVLLKKFLAKKDVAAIKLCPPIKVTDSNCQEKFDNLIKLGYWHFGYNNNFEALKPRYEAIIDIHKPYYELFSDIKKEYKTKIRSASKKGVVVVKGNIDSLDHLYYQVKRKYKRDLNYFRDVYEFFDKEKKVDIFYAKLDTKTHYNYANERYHTLEEQNEIINNEIVNQNTINNPKSITRKIKSDLELSEAKKEIVKATNLLSNFKDGIVIASALVIKNDTEVYLLMDGYDTNYSNLNAKHLLIWQLIEKYSNMGFKTFNLGGMTNPDIKDDKYKGLNEFKLNFNAKPIEYIGDMELIINQAKYFVLKRFPISNILKK